MHLSHLLLLIFIGIPLLEIYLLIQVGSWIGVIPTILLVIATAVVGSYLLHYQGISTLRNIQTALSQNQLPAQDLLEGLILLIGGILLLTPGFFTDLLGLSGILPWTRRYWLLLLLKQLNRWISTTLYTHELRKTETIEGKYRHEED